MRDVCNLQDIVAFKSIHINLQDLVAFKSIYNNLGSQ